MKYLKYVFIIISFIAGYFSSIVINNFSKTAKIFDKTENVYQSNCNDYCKELLSNMPYQKYEDNVEIKFISGKILEKGVNWINIRIIEFDPLLNSELNIRKVNIGPKTVLEKVIRKSNTEYQQDLLDYNKNNTDDQIEAPSNFKKINISKSELQLGQNVQIWADKNIREIKEFEASKILVEFISELK